MKRLLLLVCCLALGHHAPGATIFGTLRRPDGSLRGTNLAFRPLSTPYGQATGVVTTVTISTNANTNATFSLTLLGGNYELTIGRLPSDRTIVTVPSDTNAYDLATLITNSVNFTNGWIPSTDYMRYVLGSTNAADAAVRLEIEAAQGGFSKKFNPTQFSTNAGGDEISLRASLPLTNLITRPLNANTHALDVLGLSGQDTEILRVLDWQGTLLFGVTDGGALIGNGFTLTNLVADYLASGTVPLARLSGITSNQIASGTITSNQIALATITTNLMSKEAHEAYVGGGVSTNEWATNIALTVYVATNGNDTWPGTMLFPYETLGRAVSNAPNGSKIILRPGDYPLYGARHQNPLGDGYANVNLINRTNLWIDGGDSARLTHTNMRSGIKIHACSNIWLTGLGIVNDKAALLSDPEWLGASNALVAQGVFGMISVSDSSRIQLRRVNMFGGYNHGLLVDPGGTVTFETTNDCAVIDCSAENLGSYVGWWDGSGFVPSAGWRVQNCRTINAQACVEVYPVGTAAELPATIVIGCEAVNCRVAGYAAARCPVVFVGNSAWCGDMSGYPFIAQTHKAGFSILGGNRTLLLGNTVENYPYGIYLWNGNTNATIIGNSINKCSLDAVIIEVSQPSRGLHFQGNLYRACPRYAVYIYGDVTDVSFRDERWIDCGTNAEFTAAIRILDWPTGSHVTNLTFANCNIRNEIKRAYGLGIDAGATATKVRLLENTWDYTTGMHNLSAGTVIDYRGIGGETATNSATELIASGGITLGGVRNTTWPAGGGTTNWTVSTTNATRFAIVHQGTNATGGIKSVTSGSNVTIEEQGTNLVFSASITGGAASKEDVTNIVQSLGTDPTNFFWLNDSFTTNRDLAHVTALGYFTNRDAAHVTSQAALTNRDAANVTALGYFTNRDAAHVTSQAALTNRDAANVTALGYFTNRIVLTNLFSAGNTNTTRFAVVAAGTNTSGGVKTISAGANVIITEEGTTNVVLAASGGAASTNFNTLSAISVQVSNSLTASNITTGWLVVTNSQTNSSLTVSNLILDGVNPGVAYFAVADTNLTNLAQGTGMLTNNGSGTLGWMAIPGGGSGSTQMVTFAAGTGTITNALTIFGNLIVGTNLTASNAFNVPTLNANAANVTNDLNLSGGITLTNAGGSNYIAFRGSNVNGGVILTSSRTNVMTNYLMLSFGVPAVGEVLKVHSVEGQTALVTNGIDNGGSGDAGGTNARAWNTNRYLLAPNAPLNDLPNANNLTVANGLALYTNGSALVISNSAGVNTNADTAFALNLAVAANLTVGIDTFLKGLAYVSNSIFATNIDAHVSPLRFIAASNYVTGATFVTNNLTVQSNLTLVTGQFAGNGAGVTNLGVANNVAFQPADADLTNFSMLSPIYTNAELLVGTISDGVSRWTNFQRGTDGQVLKVSGTNLAWSADLQGGGGGLTTNANQFGASVELTIKSGALLTNLVAPKDLFASNVMVTFATVTNDLTVRSNATVMGNFSITGNNPGTAATNVFGVDGSDGWIKTDGSSGTLNLQPMGGTVKIWGALEVSNAMSVATLNANFVNATNWGAPTNLATAANQIISLDQDTTVAITNAVAGNVNVLLTNCIDRRWLVLRAVADGSARTVSFFSNSQINWISTNATSSATNLYIPANKIATLAGRIWLTAGVTNVDLFANVQP